MPTTFYSFDGDIYADTEDGQQQLTTAIYDALWAEAISDPENEYSASAASEAVHMSFDGTNVGLPFWQNIMSIMQQSPYELNVRKVEATVEPSGGEELTESEKFQIAQELEDQ